MGGGSPEKEPKIIIAELKESFKDWLKKDPEQGAEIKSELLSIAGQSESELNNDGMVIVKVPAGELSIFSTFCGTKGNKAFDENVLNFLKDKEVEFVVAISDEEVPKITSAVIKISQEDGETLSEMISENEGSLRYDKTKIEGWSAFESE